MANVNERTVNCWVVVIFYKSGETTNFEEIRLCLKSNSVKLIIYIKADLLFFISLFSIIRRTRALNSICWYNGISEIPTCFDIFHSTFYILSGFDQRSLIFISILIKIETIRNIFQLSFRIPKKMRKITEFLAKIIHQYCCMWEHLIHVVEVNTIYFVSE